MQKTPQVSRGVLSQSTGGPGLFSGATVAPADVAHAQVVSEREAAGAGGPGFSSGLTTATTTPVPCPADSNTLVSHPDSPAVKASYDQSTTSGPLTAPPFTVASDDIRSSMEKLMRSSKVEFKSSPTSTMAILEQYSWYTRDDDACFLLAPEDPSPRRKSERIFVRPSYVDVYKILHDMW